MKPARARRSADATECFICTAYPRYIDPPRVIIAPAVGNSTGVLAYFGTRNIVWSWAGRSSYRLMRSRKRHGGSCPTLPLRVAPGKA